MKTISVLSGLVLVTGITVLSCTKNPVNPTASSVKFKIQATSKVQPVTKDLIASGSTNLTSNSFAWDTCLMVVSKIELEAEKENESKSGAQKSTGVRKDGGDSNSDSGKGGNDSGNKNEENSSDSTRLNFEWTGPVKVDLFNLNSVIGGITLLPGTFNNVSIKIESFKSDAGKSPVFYLTGDYTNAAGTVKRINVVVNEDFELRINRPDTLNAGHDFTSIIKLNLVLLLGNITQTELDNADLTNGKIVISSTSNVALFNKIKTNLHGSEDSELERD